MTNDSGSDHDHRQDRSVRDGQIAPVTCDACGCRLEAVEGPEGVSWFHFGRLGGRDARGDRVVCLDAPHDAGGRTALAA